MRGIAGVFYFHDRSVPPSDFAYLRAAAGDSGRLYGSGQIAMASGGSDELDALADAGHAGACAWDGVLHNQPELARELCLHPSSSAAEVALACYADRGARAFTDLLGDWSVTLWDGWRGVAHLASDYAGVRPVYFAETNACLRWASSLSLLRDWTQADELDEGFAASFLAGYGNGGRTPYRGIRPLAPGCVLSVSSSGMVKMEAHWRPSAAEPDLRDADEGYAARFRDLFETAVARRMNTRRAACAELSGGLDSSSVACVAARLIRDGRVPAPNLMTVSYDAPRSADGPFIEHVENVLGVRGVHLNFEDYPPVAASCAGVSEPLCWEPRFRRLQEEMERAGAGVLLTGQLGDLVTGNWFDDSEQVADLIVQGRWTSAVKDAFAWSRALRVPVYGLLWRALALSAGRNQYSIGAEQADRWGDSLSRAMRDKVSMPKRDAGRHGSPSRAKRAWLLRCTLDSGFSRCPETLAGISYSHPFIDRTLNEFLLRVPSGVICRPGEPRKLMRRALRGIVPDRILARRSKGGYDHAYLRALMPLAASLLPDVRRLEVVERGWIDPAQFAARLQRIRGGLDANLAQLRCVIVMEFWLRNRGTNHRWSAPDALPALAAAC
jgi:asparagine synthase (glutamine-hydrolysing)